MKTRGAIVRQAPGKYEGVDLVSGARRNRSPARQTRHSAALGSMFEGRSERRTAL